jgi:ABC-2 type transport system permease protein
LRRFDLRRLIALVTKESYQALRDPSTLLIAFVLPVVLLLLFAYAVSLDAKDVRVGVVLESPGASAQELAAAFSGTRFLMCTSPMTGAKWPTSWSQATCAATW